jgi:nickel superoxide dismutase
VGLVIFVVRAAGIVLGGRKRLHDRAIAQSIYADPYRCLRRLNFSDSICCRRYFYLTMLKNIVAKISDRFPAEAVHAHCDGPCGVYDPADARIKAEAVLSMTKKILDLGAPDTVEKANTFARYTAIKEEQAQKTKEELLILWTDYFKPVHLEKYPDLHDTFWKATKLCSACKVEVSLEHANELMAAVEKVHNMFWATKDRVVNFYKAS